jgi:hypothetical protein
MRYILPNSAKSQEFIKFYNYDVYRFNIPLAAIVIEDTDITDALTVPAKKGHYVSVLDISTCGWCYIQTEKQRGFIPCRFLQLQHEIQRIPRQYTKHFFSAEIKDVFIANNDKRSKQLKYYDITPSFFRADIEAKDKGSIPYLKPKAKRRRPPRSKIIECQECATNSTPEWRSGPNGKRSLCNACGIKWYKKQKALRAHQDKEKGTNNEADKETLTRGDSPILYATGKEECLLKYSLNATTKQSDEEKIKNPTPEKLPVVDKEENNRTSIPVNKLSLAYICNK